MMKKIFVLLVAVLFTGISLMAVTSAHADCRSCCNSCRADYQAAVGGPPPSEDDFRRSMGTPSENYPAGLNCVVEALIAFGGCCALSNCLLNEAYFYVCVGWGLDVYWQCEQASRISLNSCQDSCPCCAGC